MKLLINLEHIMLCINNTIEQNCANCHKNLLFNFIDANKRDGLVDESCKLMQDFIDVSFLLICEITCKCIVIVSLTLKTFV